MALPRLYQCAACQVGAGLPLMALHQTYLPPVTPTTLHKGSEHSRTDGDAPETRVAAFQQLRPCWDKSIGHGQSDQTAEQWAANSCDVAPQPERRGLLGVDEAERREDTGFDAHALQASPLASENTPR